MSYTPLITIIIATYNAEKFLTAALNSIREQLYKNFELIIIDGKSTDSTIDIFNRNKDIVAYSISEKDKGIYDAWNKGIEVSKGDWVLFIGADDILLPDAILNYVAFIEKNYHQDKDYISSKIQLISPKSESIVKTIGERWEWPKFNHTMTVAHPGSFHSRKLFDKFGKYDISYKITGDYELLMRPGKKLNAGFMDIITVRMTKGGASDSFKAINEYYTILVTTGNYSPIKAVVYKLVLQFKFTCGLIFYKVCNT